MYTLIFLSSRKNSVRQQAISQGHVLFFACLVLVLLLAGISGIGYGIFQNYQRSISEKKLQVSAEEIQQLVHTKLQVELELAAVNEEMRSIRHMTETIQKALGILGQGGGDTDIDGIQEGDEGHPKRDPEDAPSPSDTDVHSQEMQGLLTPSILKQEMLPLYAYVSDHQKQIDGYPSILPVGLQKVDGGKHAFWYSSRFGWRTHPLTRKREFHRGLDIKTRAGIPVVAAADGTVVTAQRNRLLGNTVEIVHDASPYKTLYAHLKGYADGLKAGQKVKRGQVIGSVGNTGRSTGAHLHYGVYDTMQKQWVNPFAYIFDQKPTLSP